MIDNVVRCGSLTLFHADDFLPANVRDSFYSFALTKLPEFKSHSRTLKDPEYQFTKVLNGIGPFQSLFQRTLLAAWRDVALALGTAITSPNELDFDLSVLNEGAYRKPRSEEQHGKSRGALSCIYALGRQPKPYAGGFITFYDHNPYVNPYDRSVSKFRRQVEFPATPNSIVIFPSDSYYAVSDIKPVGANEINACFLLDVAAF